MKRIFTLVAFLGMFVGGMFAQSGSLVTLSHEGQLSFFEGYDALEKALEAAQNDDVLYLSRGMYAINSPEIVINKKVRLVGDGYDTFINSNIQFVSDGEAWTYTDAEPALEGLRITQLNNTVNDTGCTDMMVIRTCRVDVLGIRAGSETYILDRCYIGSVNKTIERDLAPIIYAKNCKIGLFEGLGENIVFENCNIKQLRYFGGKAFNCFIIEFGFGDFTSTFEDTGYAYNCWFNVGTDMFFSDARFEECNICNLSQVENLNVDYNQIGSDGTLVGIKGGQFPYSESPSLPTVNVANSSVSYDSSNNQLNVIITVKE